MNHTLEIRHPGIPDGLVGALARQCQFLKYTRPQTLYYCVAPDYRNIYVGVFGDGGNGAYEWFIWDADTRKLRTSDCGFGCEGVALCHGLVESGAHTSAGDHDEFLMWGRHD
jgi:hypothetical protein